MNDLENMHQSVADLTGVPVIMLTGENVEETIAQAKAFLAYKRDHDKTNDSGAAVPKNARDAFKTWLTAEPETQGQPTAPEISATTPAKEAFKAFAAESMANKFKGVL